MAASAPVDIIPRPPENALPWEKLSVALVDILGGMQQIVTVDELKRADAALGEAYRNLSSFERLTQSAVDVLVAKGLVDKGDLRIRMARLAVTLTTNQYKAGTTSYLSVVQVQATQLANERTQVGIVGERLAATVALVRALGGGWRTSELPPGK